MAGRRKSSAKSLKNVKVSSESSKAGLQFPVGKVAYLLKSRKFAKRTDYRVPVVLLTAVLQYLAAEVLEVAGNAAKDNQKKEISVRHIELAVRNDEELNKLLGSVIIKTGSVDVMPNIHNLISKMSL